MEQLRARLLSVCILMLLLGGAQVTLAAPPNDACINARPIGDVVDLPFETREATPGGPGGCISSPNLWYCYTATCTGTATASLLGSGFDTKLAVYNGCGCDAKANDRIACNDDFGGTYQSQISFPVVGGQQYLIEVGGYAADVGQGILNVSCDGIPVPEPSKDDCVHAQPITDVNDLPFDTLDATADGPGLCMVGPNVWYSYTATCTGDVTVSLLGSAFDTMLAVYDGNQCDLTQEDLIGCNDDFESSFQSLVTFAAIAGNQYLIEIGGYGPAKGEGILNVSCKGTSGGGGGGAAKPDLGDAPDSTNNFGNKEMGSYPWPPTVPGHFPTVYNDGSGLGPYGPVHLNDPLIAHLGERISAETEADKGPDEDHKGTNNLVPLQTQPNHDGYDDSVDMPLTLPNGGWTMFDYQVNVIVPGTDLWVNVWFDYNRDADWDDTIDSPSGPVQEWAVQNQFLFNLPAGLHTITTPGFKSVHPEGAPDQIWMRITLAEQPWTGGSNPGELGNAGSGPVEKYQVGETEDYYFVPVVPAGGDCPLCQDVNGDGVIDMNDLADLTAQWLATCL